MRSRSERPVTFGPVVHYPQRGTWTAEVKEYYEQLKAGDVYALAPLLSFDLLFLCDVAAAKALVLLKTDTCCPAAQARRELRRIANLITRRHGRRRAKLPPGDFLYVELAGLADFIERNRLLDLQDDRDALNARIDELLPTTPGKQSWENASGALISEDGHQVKVDLGEAELYRERDRTAIREALWDGREYAGVRLRAGRSWALFALARFYGVKSKMIEKQISRDPIGKRLQAQNSRIRRRQPLVKTLPADLPPTP